MPPTTEIDAITTLDKILSDLQDPATRDRVLKWAWDKFATKPLPLLEPPASETRSRRSRTNTKVKAAKKAKASPKARAGWSIVKDLNLRPEGKMTFKDFAQEKQPGDNQEKCTVAVYYLCRELGLDAVSIGHIFTCYKDGNWRVPNLYNVLAITASNTNCLLKGRI